MAENKAFTIFSENKYNHGDHRNKISSKASKNTIQSDRVVSAMMNYYEADVNINTLLILT